MTFLSCATPSASSETPMSLTCREVPTVEECLDAAATIENVCLRPCVERQCSGAKVACDENIVKKCNRLNESRRDKVGGWVERKDQTCKAPRSEIAWCQVPMSRQYRAKAMVHELAHSCGWKHGEGQGVPGNSGSLECE